MQAALQTALTTVAKDNVHEPSTAPAGGARLGEPIARSINELLAPENLQSALAQGWRKVTTKIGSETPPALVGASFSCLEVPTQAKGRKEYDSDESGAVSADRSQLGLFLFGGDNDENQQTDALYVFYLQDQRWRKPLPRGRPPSRRSRHTGSVVTLQRKQRLLIFGGVGAGNDINLLDPETIEWSHPPARSKPGEKEKANRRKKRSGEDAIAALLPCARFGHTATVVGDHVLIFGGTDFRGPLGDLYELDLAVEPMEWSRPEPAGLPPPPSGRHCCAVVRGHMLLISGEPSWGGHLWSLRLPTSSGLPMMWFRSAIPDFPMLGVSRHATVEYVTPRPYRREEILIFGGVLESYSGESEVLDAFFTLDLRSWRETESEMPRETWADVEKKLIDAGKEAGEITQARSDWEDDMRRKQREIQRANRRNARRGLLFGKIKQAELAEAAAEEGGEEEEELDEAAIAAREADREFELPPERMPTIIFGEWVPLRVGRHLPPPRFGHAMAMAGSTAFVFGGRNRSMLAPVLDDFYSFEGAPILWKAVSYDGDGPGSRVSHAMIQLEHYLYVLGGGSGNRSFNDLHRLDLYTMHWELIHTRGELPGSKPDALIGHSVQWVDPFLVVFGGGDGRKPSNDLHTLELATATWRHIETKGAPPAPRVGHSSTQIGAEMYIVGGFSKGKYFHDVHVLHVETLQWSQQVTSGTPPHGRVSHSATLHEGSIHMFGGSAGGTAFNDYFVLTPASSKSAAASSSSTSTALTPASASKSRTASVARAATWRSPEVAGFPPEPRFAHTANALGPLLFIVGGLNRKGKPYDDLHVLDLNALEWSFPRVSLEGPPARGRHTVATVGSVLFLFGGGAQGHLYDDIWALDIDGKGMGRLEQLATQDVLGEEGRRREREQQIPLSFLAPNLGEEAEEVYPVHLEYEDVTAREADADEVRSWLTHLGLAQYAYTFEVHEIDFEVLLELQEHDLVDMRIDDPTSRLKLLNGIEVLRARGALAAVGRAPRERLFRERYRLGAEVNFGGSPAVLAVDCKTDLKVVIKFLPTMADYHRQLQLYHELKLDSIARLADSYAAYREGQVVPGGSDTPLQRGWDLPCLVVEYGDCSLADYMSRGLLAPIELKATFEAALKAVVSLHAKRYAHTALQPESFRLYQGVHWRLATLDSVTPMGEPTPAKCPVCYAAPEVVKHLRPRSHTTTGAALSSLTTAPASPAMDVWSLGAVLWQLFSQQPLYGSEPEAMAMLSSPAFFAPSMGCVTDTQASHLITKMLQRHPHDRIESTKIAKHGYLTGGLDTVQMENTFGPMQKGQLFLRSLLQQISGAVQPKPKGGS